MARIDYEHAASTYDSARSLPRASFAEWAIALKDYWPALLGPVVDVGSGTGIWMELLADWFDKFVVGVEPAASMREKSAARSVPGSAIVAGEGSALPLKSESCSTAWLSTVIHHLDDLWACAVELRRVLRPGGVVLIRSSFPGRHDEIPLFQFFPGARKIASSFPTVDGAVSAFTSAGFQYWDLRRVHEARDLEPGHVVQRVLAMRHADSTLAPLSDQEFEAGLGALEDAVLSMEYSPPTGLDLLVFRLS